jgi:poly-beta-1,6-N-acetyl-D-glucosamine biosynthesis protein PgaD
MTEPNPPDGLIIDVPHKMSAFRRGSDALLTVVATIIWMFAFRPLLLLVLWYVGFRVAHLHMIELQGIDNPRFFALLALMTIGTFGVQFLWSRYNAYRFRGLDRRRTMESVSTAEMAAHYAVPPEKLERLHDCRTFRMARLARDLVEIACSDGSLVVVRHDPLGVRPAPLGPQVAAGRS